MTPGRAENLPEGLRRWLDLYNLLLNPDAREATHLGLIIGSREPVALNCGYGHGYSVREVIRAIEKIHGQRLNVREEPRRAGDPPTLVAGADRIRSVLAWHPRYDNLEFIVKTSLDWEQRRFY